jgi:hypothetical protein
VQNTYTAELLTILGSEHRTGKIKSLVYVAFPLKRDYILRPTLLNDPLNVSNIQFNAAHNSTLYAFLGIAENVTEKQKVKPSLTFVKHGAKGNARESERYGTQLDDDTWPVSRPSRLIPVPLGRRSRGRHRGSLSKLGKAVFMSKLKLLSRVG